MTKWRGFIQGIVDLFNAALNATWWNSPMLFFRNLFLLSWREAVKYVLPEVYKIVVSLNFDVKKRYTVDMFDNNELLSCWEIKRFLSWIHHALICLRFLYWPCSCNSIHVRPHHCYIFSVENRSLVLHWQIANLIFIIYCITLKFQFPYQNPKRHFPNRTHCPLLLLQREISVRAWWVHGLLFLAHIPPRLQSFFQSM